MGTMILIFFGDGVNNQVTLVSTRHELKSVFTHTDDAFPLKTANPAVSQTQQGSYLSISVNHNFFQPSVASFVF
jgi:glycerol uptake facilitator-like aquaporin